MHVRELSVESLELLTQQLGPFALIQRPTPQVYGELAKVLRRGQTVAMAHEARLPHEILSMLQEFEKLLVFSMKGLHEKGELTLGRAPECDLIIHEPSVSSRHAVFHYQPTGELYSLTDADSRNGTFVNAKRIFARETVLADGDALSFGDAQFLLLKPETLREQVQSFRARAAK